MGDQRFRPEYHVRRGEDFDRTYARRRSASDSVLLIFGCENDLGYSRIGLSVSKKVGKAPVRNHWKRLIREAFRTSREQLPVGYDWVFIPRARTRPTLAAVTQSLDQLTRRIANRIERESSSVRESK